MAVTPPGVILGLLEQADENLHAVQAFLCIAVASNEAALVHIRLTYEKIDEVIKALRSRHR